MLGIIQSWRRRRYINQLVRRGMTLGRDVALNDGFFLDPSHCFLITIEDGVTFGPGVKVFAHDASSLKCLGTTRIGLVRLRRNAFIGANSVILPGVTVGEDSIVGANSTVARDIPAREVWAGTPAQRLSSVDHYVRMLSLRGGRTFTEGRYAIDRITDERRQEMIAALERDRIGFMAP